MLSLVAMIRVNGATYTWQGANNASWATSTNWNPTRTTPATNDVLQFNTGTTLTITAVPTQTIGKLLVTNSTTITLKPQSGNNITLTVSSATSDAIVVESSSSLIIIGLDETTDRTLTLTTSNTSGLIANISGTLTVGIDNNQANAAGVFTKGGTNAVINFNSGSNYIHARDGGTIPTATWNANSTCNITGVTGTIAAGTNQNFGNFIYNSTQTGPENLATTSIAGNLTIIKTGGTNQLRLSSSLTVLGNFEQSGGYFNIDNNAGRTLTVAGNVSISGGTLDLNRGGGKYRRFNRCW